MTDDNHTPYRMDFKVEIISFDKKTGMVQFALIPDPRRYEWRTIDDTKYLYDKLDRTLISEEVLAKTAPQMAGLPIYAQSPKIRDARDYVRSRRVAIAAGLDGEPRQSAFNDASEEFLRSLEEGGYDFAILSVDIVGSTRLATQLPGDQYARIVAVILDELSAMVPLFHGHVLKYTGDGLIAYFPGPSFLTKNDLGIDCALCMGLLMREAVAPELSARGLPALTVRQGMDTGRAIVLTIGAPSTKRHRDILGSTVSLACKIQARAPEGGLAIGQATLQCLHTQWRILFTPLDPGPNWGYGRDGEPYRVHQFIPPGCHRTLITGHGRTLQRRPLQV